MLDHIPDVGSDYRPALALVDCLAEIAQLLQIGETLLASCLQEVEQVLEKDIIPGLSVLACQLPVQPVNGTWSDEPVRFAAFRDVMSHLVGADDQPGFTAEDTVSAKHCQREVNRFQRFLNFLNSRTL